VNLTGMLMNGDADGGWKVQDTHLADMRAVIAGALAETDPAAARTLVESIQSPEQKKRSTAAFAAQYGATPYADLETMLGAVDAIVICTPHPLHAAPALPALARGIHVLVEKPLAATVDDCDRMLEAAV
jgi:predicted dehydrogenase